MLKSFGWKKETELEKSVKRLKANDPSLTELNLYYNSIGDDGTKAIAEALKVNTVLTELNLYDNSIGVDGAKSIAFCTAIICPLFHLINTWYLINTWCMSYYPRGHLIDSIRVNKADQVSQVRSDFES